VASLHREIAGASKARQTEKPVLKKVKGGKKTGRLRRH